MKRANETLDLPATGDTTTSNASQEDIVEKNINEILPALAVGAAAAATGAAAYKAGGAIHKGFSNIKKKLSSYGKRTSNPAGESVEEATFSKGQMDALVKGFGPLGGSERNKIKMDKVADILKKLPKDALMQLSKANLPMVSKVAKQLSEIGNQSYPSGYKSGYKGGIGVSFMDRNRELSRKYASAASKVAKIPMGPKKL